MLGYNDGIKSRVAVGTGHELQTTIHENLHQLSANGSSHGIIESDSYSRRNVQMNEAITEMLTQRTLGEQYGNTCPSPKGIVCRNASKPVSWLGGIFTRLFRPSFRLSRGSAYQTAAEITHISIHCIQFPRYDFGCCSCDGPNPFGRRL